MTEEISTKTNECNLQAISGFADYKEADHIQIDAWIQSLKNVFSKSGFSPFHPRPAEYTEMLVKKGGITGQVYTIGRYQDNTMTDLALPFDRTVPLALWINRHASTITFPYKRFDISYSWRGEHAQKGRFRAFYQADVDVLGKDLSLLADAECLASIWKGLNALNISDFHMYLNHMQVSRSLISTLHPQEEQIPLLLGIIDKIEKISRDDLIAEINKLLPERSLTELNEFYDRINFKGSICDFPFDSLKNDSLAMTAFEQLKELFNLLIMYNIDASRVQFCPSMVRGLNYYTGIVFETFLDDFPRGGSIASGGRYNDLVGKISDHPSKQASDIEGVGGSIGVTRLFELLKDKVRSDSRTQSDVFIMYRDDEAKNESFQKRAIGIASNLRERGIKVDIQCVRRKMGQTLSYADKKGYPYIISIMDDSSVVVRNLQSKKQDDLASDELAIETLMSELKKLK